MLPLAHLHYRQQQVRDLAWVINSPPLLALPQCHLLNQEHDPLPEWLAQLNHDPSALLAHLQAVKRHTLGSYYEGLVSFWLTHRPNTLLCAANLQIQQGTLSIGEIDFIIREGNTTIHLETAVKFYLGVHNQESWEDWAGPNGQDTLQKKMDKLLNKQLLLSQHALAQAVLAARGLIPDYSALLLKGYFFYHYPHFFQHSGISPAQAHPMHNKGWWCRVNEVTILPGITDATYLWAIPPKSRWLSPAYYDDKEELYSGEQLVTRLHALFAIPENPACLVVALRQAATSGYDEQHRGFVVSEGYYPFI